MTMPMTSGSTSVEHTKPRRPPLAHLPGEDGWPIVGNTFAALKDPVRHVEAMYRKHGPVYRDHLFGVRSVAMLGPEANELVLFDRDKNFSSSMGWGFLLDQLFPRGLMLMDFEEHSLHRKALGVAFKPTPMKAYLGALNNGISRRIAQWHLTGSGQGGTTDLQFYPAIKQLTLDLAATSFLGIELGAQANAVNRAFVDMVAAIIGVVRAPIPGTQMWKGVKGREVIVAFFCQEIPRRRAGQATDLFSELCRATKEDGSLLTDQEIADHMSFLMMAAHDTLTSSVTSLGLPAGQAPGVAGQAASRDARARSSTRCTASLRTTGRARSAGDGLQGINAHQSAGAWDTTRRRARLPIQRSPHSGWHTRCHQHHVYASHAGDLAGARKVRSAALYRRGRPQPAQVRVGTLRGWRAHVLGAAFCLHAGKELLLPPVDDHARQR